MPSHKHALNTAANAGAGTLGAGYGLALTSSKRYLTPVDNSTSGELSGWGTVATGGGQAHNNLSPYITVYFWRRSV